MENNGNIKDELTKLSARVSFIAEIFGGYHAKDLFITDQGLWGLTLILEEISNDLDALAS